MARRLLLLVVQIEAHSHPCERQQSSFNSIRIAPGQQDKPRL